MLGVEPVGFFAGGLVTPGSPGELAGFFAGGFVVFGIAHLPYAVMAGFSAVLFFAAALEWALLAGFSHRRSRIAYAIVTLAGAALLSGYASVQPRVLSFLLILASAWWLLALLWVWYYQHHGRPRIEGRFVLAICGWLALLPAMIALLFLLDAHRSLLLTVLALVWAADILAFCGGKMWGRHRLASRVSPGKTWEGLASALIGTPVLALGYAHWTAQSLPPAAAIVIAITLIAAVVGDLLESLLKRLRGVKDSGQLLPGHGGVLDRIDSVLAAAPLFTLGFILLERP